VHDPAGKPPTKLAGHAPGIYRCVPGVFRLP